jgi:magnesium-transporting ATPase (P-type)
MKRGERKMFRVPAIEVTLSLISCWWAIVLFNSPNMFNNLPDLYLFFGEISQETHWGIIFSIAALLKIFGIVLKRNKLRKIGLGFSFVLYGLISAGFFLATDIHTGSGTYAALSFMALWGIREVEVRNG